MLSPLRLPVCFYPVDSLCSCTLNFICTLLSKDLICFQKTVNDLSTNKLHKREKDLEEQLCKVEKELREKIDELSEKLSQNSKETRRLKVSMLH